MAEDVFIADTHALLWFFLRSPLLSPAARELLLATEAGTAEVVVPTMMLAELLHIAERRRAPIDFADVWRRLREIPGFVVAPFDLAVFEAMLELPSNLEIHDRILAATARVYGARVITADAQLQASGAVECVW